MISEEKILNAVADDGRAESAVSDTAASTISLAVANFYVCYGLSLLKRCVHN